MTGLWLRALSINQPKLHLISKTLSSFRLQYWIMHNAISISLWGIDITRKYHTPRCIKVSENYEDDRSRFPCSLSEFANGWFWTPSLVISTIVELSIVGQSEAVWMRYSDGLEWQWRDESYDMGVTRDRSVWTMLRRQTLCLTYRMELRSGLNCSVRMTFSSYQIILILLVLPRVSLPISHCYAPISACPACVCNWNMLRYFDLRSYCVSEQYKLLPWRWLCTYHVYSWFYLLIWCVLYPYMVATFVLWQQWTVVSIKFTEL